MWGVPEHRGDAREREGQHGSATEGSIRDRLSSSSSLPSDNIHVKINNG